jgi:hypothetical protein
MHILVWGLVGQLLAAIVLACSGLFGAGSGKLIPILHQQRLDA